MIDGIHEVNVYGVAVPGQDGLPPPKRGFSFAQADRAGMAALVVAPDFDPTNLAHALAGNLAPYARPVFLRLRPEMEITGTFKQRKVELVKVGFDPRLIHEPLYVLDQETNTYKRLDAATYAGICEGRVKV